MGDPTLRSEAERSKRDAKTNDRKSAEAVVVMKCL